MDFAAGVAAFQAFQRQLKGLETCRNGFTGQRQIGGEVDPPRATHVDLTFFFGVGVDQNICLQPVSLQTKRTVHARFFGHGQQNFQRAVNHAVIGQNGQRRGHTDTVIRTQRGATGFHPFAVNIRLDRIFGEVVNGIVVFLRHHIQVRLQNNRLAVFHSCGSGFANQDITHLIALDVETFLLGPTQNMFSELLFMVGRMRNRTDFGKNIPQRLRG